MFGTCGTTAGFFFNSGNCLQEKFNHPGTEQENDAAAFASGLC